MNTDNTNNTNNTDIKRYRELLTKFFISGLYGAALMIADMSGFIPPIHTDQTNFFWMGISALTLFIMYYCGGRFFSRAWNALKIPKANMNALISLGTGAAWLYSTLVILIPHLLPKDSRHVYFESAVIIIALVNLGSALETRAGGKTKAAIKKLIGLQPKTARIVKGNQTFDIPVKDIKIGDLIRVRPGERIPVDGVVIEGDSHIDESMLTGESKPVRKTAGDFASTGTINQSGSLIIQAKAIGEKTVLAHIVDMVRQAQTTKPSIAKLTDKIASIFVPIVLLIAAFTAIGWFYFGHPPVLPNMLTATTAVLLIACPCALGLAIPTSITVGMGKGAEHGILIRNGEALQRATELTTIVLDKTGTLTEGKPNLVDLFATPNHMPEDILAIAASIEQNSEHPYAKAILNEAENKNITLLQTHSFTSISGKGVKANVNNVITHAGNIKLMTDNNIDIKPAHTFIKKCTDQAFTPILVAQNNKIIGALAVADPIKPNAKEVIQQLKKRNLKVVLLSGDNEKTARAVANKLDIETVIADVLPDQKIEKIRHLQQRGEIVGMVGDGINDAPALTQADVGFAIGTGTDVAIASADITLMSGNLQGINNAIELSTKTMRNIKQNLFGAFFYNTISIPVAAGVFYPWLGILLSPMIAGGAMAASSLTVVLNANRLRRLKLNKD